MNRLWTSAILMLIGAGGGLYLASDNVMLAAAMGAVLGAVASLIVRTYPRDHDYTHNGDDCVSKF